MINDKNILVFDVRQKIYEFISRNPGLHHIEISRKLKIPNTTLYYHITFLKKLGLITEKNDGKYKRIYASIDIDPKEKEIINLIRKEVPCRIFLHILFSISCSQIELSKELEIHPASVSYHLKKMVEIGIIEEAPSKNGIIDANIGKYISCEPVGREIFYRRKNQKIINTVYGILIKYKKNLPNKKIINSYINYLKEVDNYISTKKIDNVDDRFDSIIETLQDLIKPFFCA